jgi:hypothetical protein
MEPSDRQIILVPFQNTMFNPQLNVQNPIFGIQLSPDVDSQTYISQNKNQLIELAHNFMNQNVNN